MRDYDLDPLIAEELLVPSFKPKVERRGDTIYAILHFPAPRVGGRRPEQEIDFVIGKHFLITAHYAAIDPLHSFAKAFEVDSVLHRTHAQHGGHLFALLAKELYRTLLAECETLRHRLDAIEDHIFVGDERAMVMHLSHAARAVHDFRQILVPHREMLVSLEAATARMFDPGYSWWVRDVIGTHDRVEQTLLHLRESAQELRYTNDSLLNTKQNEIMKTLTMMAFVTFPLTLIAALFSMDTHGTPIVGMPGDFWIIVGMMLVLVAGMLAYFKHKRWL